MSMTQDRRAVRYLVYFVNSRFAGHRNQWLSHVLICVDILVLEDRKIELELGLSMLIYRF